MRRPRIGRVLLDCFSLSLCTSTCVCVRALEDAEEEAVQRAALVTASDHHHHHRQLRLKDLVDGAGTLGFHLQPKTVELRVSMHCNGCARKVHKHISKMEDPCYAAFHDQEWGVPVHDDKKLFEMLTLSGALAEMAWPAILSKRDTFS